MSHHQISPQSLHCYQHPHQTSFRSLRCYQPWVTPVFPIPCHFTTPALSLKCYQHHVTSSHKPPVTPLLPTPCHLTRPTPGHSSVTNRGSLQCYQHPQCPARIYSLTNTLPVQLQCCHLCSLFFLYKAQMATDWVALHHNLVNCFLALQLVQYYQYPCSIQCYQYSQHPLHTSCNVINTLKIVKVVEIRFLWIVVLRGSLLCV